MPSPSLRFDAGLLDDAAPLAGLLAWNLASCCGVVGKGSPPLVSKKAFAAGVFKPICSSSFRRATTGAGVFAGT
jgi:hypothetical protein